LKERNTIQNAGRCHQCCNKESINLLLPCKYC